MAMRSPLLLGHRGARASRTIQENTLASFDLALEHGCDGFEFDVRLSADGRAVICHDPKVSGIEIARANQCELNLPLLGDVVERYAQRAFLNIELKVVGLEEIALAALKQHAPARFVISSFLPQVLTELRSRDPRIPLGFICDRANHLAHWAELPVQYVIPQYDLVDRQLIRDVHAAGKLLFVWTVNERETMIRFADWGADAIISDDTELLLRTLGTRTANDQRTND